MRSAPGPEGQGSLLVSPITGDDREEPQLLDLHGESREEEPSTPNSKYTIDSVVVCDLCKGGYEPHNCLYSGPGGHSAQCSWLKAFKARVW